MRDIWEYLLLAAVIGVGVFSEIKKSKTKKSAEQAAMPTPATKPISTSSTKKKEHQQETVAALKARKAKEEMMNSKLPVEGKRSTYTPISPAAEVSILNDNTVESEFAISTPEEARKAIIWSEILQKRY